MTIDASETTALEPCKAAATPLAWSLDDQPGEALGPAGDHSVERYSWGLVWRNAALLVVAAVLAAALLVLMRDHPESVPVAAVTPPPAPAAMPTMGSAADADAPATVYLRAPGAPAPVGPDNVFLAELGSAGIPVSSTAEAVEGGREVCEDIKAGRTPQQEIQLAMRNNNLLTPEHAQALVAAAIDAYCPSG